MARRPETPTDTDDPAPERGTGAEVVRRAPFSDNPTVGARGQRTQQRILDAAVEVFGEEGYHQASIDRIAKRAGCSRASFYQYFSSKEDSFQQLTGLVARQLGAATEALGPVGADAAGWTELRGWISRYAEIHTRYEPVFGVFQAAAETDANVATGSERWAARTRAQLSARLDAVEVPARHLDATIQLLHACVTRTLDMARILRASDVDPEGAEAAIDALTDVAHRTLYGRLDDVNVHVTPTAPSPALPFDPAIRSALTGELRSSLTAAGLQTMTRLMDAGRAAFVARGYHDTRVDDVVAAAGVSHGAFYRYFDSKDHLARVLATEAMQAVSKVLVEIPPADRIDPDDGRALRSWLRRYNSIQSEHTAMLRVWTDAALQDSALRSGSAPALEWGRRTMAAYLEPRGFGDTYHDSLVMVGLLSVFGSPRRDAAGVEAAAQIIERGLLGRP